MKRIGRRLLNAQAQADEAVAVDLRLAGVVETGHYITWGSGTSVGSVVIETARLVTDPDDEWTIRETVTFDGTAPKTDYVRLEGAYRAIRHRIVTPLNDGASVTSTIEGSA